MTLPKTNSSPLKIDRALHRPTIDFQGPFADTFQGGYSLRSTLEDQNHSPTLQQ